MEKPKKGFQKGHRNYLKCHTEIVKKLLSDTRKGEDNPNWKGGKKQYICSKCGKSFLSYPRQYKNGKGRLFCSLKCACWKGDDVKYIALHQRIYKLFGKASKCEACQTKLAKRYTWANISGEYIFDKKDWLQLCSSCHIKYDRYGYSLLILGVNYGRI